MRQAWSRRGRLIVAPTPQPWAASHAALPVLEHIGAREFYVYYSPRDDQGRAHVARARVISQPGGQLEVAAHDPDPVLAPGSLGAFDDRGVTVSCVVHADGASFLYYTGWTLGVSVPFYLYVGLAVRADGETKFVRVSRAPILDRNAIDPYLTASPWVLRENGVWRMWYVSAADWRIVNGQTRHYYHVRYAESDDGIHWRREGRVSIDFANKDEYAISRPCVIREQDRYRMWFSARGESYRLGYAESRDGLVWTREDDQASLEQSRESWDANAIAYPAVVDHGGYRYMMYNGNDYGRSGIGYATLDKTS